MFIDGKEYKAEWKQGSFKVKGDIINGDNSGRLQTNKSMFLDYVGTFYNFSGTIVRRKDCTDEEWWKIFLLLTNPLNNHIVKVPFGASQMEVEIYISSGEISLKDKVDKNQWANTIEVNFVAMESQWLAGQILKGVV